MVQFFIINIDHISKFHGDMVGSTTILYDCLATAPSKMSISFLNMKILSFLDIKSPFYVLESMVHSFPKYK